MDGKIENQILNLMGQVLEKVTGLDQKVTSLDQKVTGLDQKVANLDQKVANLDQKVVNLEQDMQEVKNNIRNIAGQQEEDHLILKGLESRMDVYSAEHQNHQMKIARLEGFKVSMHKKQEKIIEILREA